KRRDSRFFLANESSPTKSVARQNYHANDLAISFSSFILQPSSLEKHGQRQNSIRRQQNDQRQRREVDRLQVHGLARHLAAFHHYAYRIRRRNFQRRPRVRWLEHQ